MTVPIYMPHSSWPWPLDAVEDWFNSLWDVVIGIAGRAARLVWDWIPSPLANFVGFLADLTRSLWDKVLAFFKDPLGSIKAGFDWVISGVTSLVGWWDPVQGRFVGGFLGWLWDSVAGVATWISNAASWVWDQIRPTLTNIWNSIAGLVNLVSEKIGDIGTWLTSTIWGWIDGALKWASDSFRWLADQVSNGLGWAVSSVGTMFDGAVSVIGDALTSLFTDPLSAITGFFTQFLTGFGVVDIAGHGAGITAIFDEIDSSYQALLAAHSPLTPEEAFTATSAWKKEQRDYWYQLYISALLIEGLSMGQIETPNMMLLTEPQGRASLALAEKWYAAPYEYGHSVRLQQYWNSVYTPQLPPVVDIIRFVVREVITPARFYELMPYLGFSREFAENYWEAHWILPAPGNLYDAFHRGIINRGELDKYLIWHDFKPEPRPGISKSDQEIMAGVIKTLIPRVDLRYAWELGRLTDEELLERYRLLGYEDDSELMTDIQKARALVEEVTKVRDEWIRYHIEGFIDEATLRANLEAVGIGPTRIDYYVAYAQKRREREALKAWLGIYEDAYVKDMLTDEELATQAGEILVEPRALELFLEKAYISKYKKPKGS